MSKKMWAAMFLASVCWMAASVSSWAGGWLPIRLESAYCTLTPGGAHEYHFTVHTKIMGPINKQMVQMTYAVNGVPPWSSVTMDLLEYNTNASLATYGLTFVAAGPIQFNFTFYYPGGTAVCCDYDKNFSLSDTCSALGSGVVGFNVSLDWCQVYQRSVPIKVGKQTVYLPMTGLKGEILVPYSDSAVSVVVRWYKDDGSSVDVLAQPADAPDCGGSLKVYTFDIPLNKSVVNFTPVLFAVLRTDQYGKTTVDNNFGMKYPGMLGQPLD